MWNSIVRHTGTCVFNFTTNRAMCFGQRYTNQFTTWRIANCIYQYILNCPFHLCLFHFTIKAGGNICFKVLFLFFQ